MSRTEAMFKIGGHDLKLSNLDKVLYPATGFTKGQVIDYYAKIAPVLLPHLKDRPLTLKRYPNGVEGEFFYEKRAPKYRPSWLKTAHVPSENDPTGFIDYCLANDLASLVWAANLADLELHPFLAKKQNVEQPTQVMFDLDPGAPADVTDCAEVALWIRDLLADLGLKCWIKSSGSKGLQLHIPLNTPTSYAVTKPFAKALAQAMQGAHPDRIVYDQKKTLREGKVLIDWSQNDSSKTTVCVYSLRAKSKPYVAAPLRWEEVEACFKKDDPKHVFFGPDEVLKRVEKDGDLFAEVLTLKQKLPKHVLEALSSAAQKTGSGPNAPAKAAKKNSPASKPGKTTAAPKKASGSLERYHAKRDFQQTREPAGQVEKAPTSKAALFVIQKHDASRLHYDFRLAMGGVLKSWAVPKGIPTHHGEKHLAVEVEDHPMDYARFEGIIPQGNYGGGTVMVWDIGEYQMLGGTPLEAWKQGLLHMRFTGKKMKGEWSLIRTRMVGDKNQWLLLKSGKDDAKISAKMDDESAVSGRSLAQIARDKDKEWQSNRTAQSQPIPEDAKAVATPRVSPARSSRAEKELVRRFVEPMKCLPVVALRTQIRRVSRPVHSARGRGGAAFAQQKIVQRTLSGNRPGCRPTPGKGGDPRWGNRGARRAQSALLSDPAELRKRSARLLSFRPAHDRRRGLDPSPVGRAKAPPGETPGESKGTALFLAKFTGLHQGDLATDREAAAGGHHRQAARLGLRSSPALGRVGEDQGDQCAGVRHRRLHGAAGRAVSLWRAAHWRLRRKETQFLRAGWHWF
jgi:bifunctional non-homologous end joining protein LigD